MIRISSPSEDVTTSAYILDQIDSLHPRWRRNADRLTRENVKARRYIEKTNPIWGIVKDIYIDLQHEKCAYCETKLAGKELASKVHEVEHFRPKSSVKAWPSPSGRSSAFKIGCSLGAASTRGYYKLAYHPLNYAIACTRCNSTLKSDFFPVRSRRNLAGADPVRLCASEEPLLIYPVAEIDEDPRSLIRFDGVLAVPKKRRGPLNHRARVTIEFFQLNHEDLTFQRAEVVEALWRNLRTVTEPGVSEDLHRDTQAAIDRARSASAKFSACACDYIDLFYRDRERASTFGSLAKALVEGSAHQE
jgi:hypothetical protein